VRSQSGGLKDFESTLADAILTNEVTMPVERLERVAGVLSDAIILIGLVEEMERQYPSAEGAKLPPQPR
jgi:hypothetical protein